MAAQTNYVWPRSLQLPARPPKLVYLDVNHWVSLAKAYTGHREAERFTDVLATCLEALENATAVFPISDSIYMEVAKIRKHRQRRDLRLVMERLSRYTVVASRVVVAQSEVEGLLDQVVGPNPDPVNTVDYLDWGVARPPATAARCGSAASGAWAVEPWPTGPRPRRGSGCRPSARARRSGCPGASRSTSRKCHRRSC